MSPEMSNPKNPRSQTKTDRPFDLEQYVPYLLNRVGMQIAFDISKDLRHSRLKYSHLRILLALLHHGAMRIIDVAGLTVFEISTLSRVVNDLERKQLICRLKNDGKGRVRKIALTPKGEETVMRVLPIVLSHEAMATSCLSSGERTLLIELLHRMRGALAMSEKR